MQNRLNIVAVENGKQISIPKLRKQEAIHAFDTRWEVNASQFDPERNAMERERIYRTWDLIQNFFEPSDKKIADLGCGTGLLACRLCQENAVVDAVDISNIALKKLEEKKIPGLTLFQDYIPRTLLKDDFYDLAIGTEIIAYLNPDEYRLFFSEMCRIIQPRGLVVCSTAIDIYSEDALQRFANLAETEFQVDKWVLSYHYLYIRLLDFLTAPSHFIKASKNENYRENELKKRYSLNRQWFRMNSNPLTAFIWRGIQWTLKPIILFVEQNRSLLILMEKISKFFWSDLGISHAIFIGKRRPLIEAPPLDKQPIERKQKRQVWE